MSPRSDRQHTTHKNGRGLGRRSPDAHADPRRGDGPDHVATKQDDHQTEHVGGHDHREARPGVPRVVLRVLGIV